MLEVGLSRPSAESSGSAGAGDPSEARRRPQASRLKW
jgi:hypothetical protein